MLAYNIQWKRLFEIAYVDDRNQYVDIYGVAHDHAAIRKPTVEQLIEREKQLEKHRNHVP